jgi:hypothetical protein
MGRRAHSGDESSRRRFEKPPIHRTPSPLHVERPELGMAEDIHQDRFALMTVLTRAHEARPDVYAQSGELMSMSDEQLVDHATELLRSLDEAPSDDDVAIEVRQALREILGGTA